MRFAVEGSADVDLTPAIRQFLAEHPDMMEEALREAIHAAVMQWLTAKRGTVAHAIKEAIDHAVAEHLAQQ